MNHTVEIGRKNEPPMRSWLVKNKEGRWLDPELNRGFDSALGIEPFFTRVRPRWKVLDAAGWSYY